MVSLAPIGTSKRDEMIMLGDDVGVEHHKRPCAVRRSGLVHTRVGTEGSRQSGQGAHDDGMRRSRKDTR